MRSGTSVGRLTRQHLVQHAAEGVDIRAAIRCAAAGLLETHVRGCAHSHSSLGELTFASLLQRPRDPEVRY